MHSSSILWNWDLGIEVDLEIQVEIDIHFLQHTEAFLLQGGYGGVAPMRLLCYGMARGGLCGAKQRQGQQITGVRSVIAARVHENIPEACSALFGCG